MVDVPLRHKVPGQRPAAAQSSPPKGGRPMPRLTPAIRRPRWPRVLLAVVVAGAVVAGLAYGARVGIDAYRGSLTLAGLTDDPRPVAVTIGSEALAIPGNMMRDASDRAGGTMKQADLILHWPTLEGFSDALATDFRDGSPQAPMVFATVAARSVALTPAERLDSVYTRSFVGDPLPAPPGLAARRLSTNSGYGGEVVFYGPPGNDRFVARCLADATVDTPATCIRDINFGQNLTLLYRFNRDIIGDWQALDMGMRSLANHLVAAPR